MFETVGLTYIHPWVSIFQFTKQARNKISFLWWTGQSSLQVSFSHDRNLCMVVVVIRSQKETVMALKDPSGNQMIQTKLLRMCSP